MTHHLSAQISAIIIVAEKSEQEQYIFCSKNHLF
jgi:hypothetical protein